MEVESESGTDKINKSLLNRFHYLRMYTTNISVLSFQVAKSVAVAEWALSMTHVTFSRASVRVSLA